MLISRPVLRSLRSYFVRKSSVDIQHISLCSTTWCEGLICAAKVMVCTRDPPLWRTLEWWDVLALDCPTNVQEDKSPVTSEHNVQRWFCYDNLLCDIITVLPCWDHLPFLLFCCFFFFLQFTLMFQMHNWFFFFFLLLSSSFYLFCYLNCHFFGCLFLNKCLVLFGIKNKMKRKVHACDD